jgi:hypothetical protein
MLMNEQKLNYKIVFINIGILFFYTIPFFIALSNSRADIGTALFFVLTMAVHLGILLIISGLMLIARKPQLAGMYFLSFSVVLLVGFPSCAFILG